MTIFPVEYNEAQNALSLTIVLTLTEKARSAFGFYPFLFIDLFWLLAMPLKAFSAG